MLVAVEDAKRVGKQRSRIWKCLCDCGKEVYIEANRFNKVKSCGCLKSPNRIGQRSGKLVIVEDLNRGDSSKRKMWLCKCDCGNEIELPTTAISNKWRKSCGCDKLDLTGNRYGNLKVIKQYDSDIHGKSQWCCVCSCGKEIVKKQESLTRCKNHNLHCGCKNEVNSYGCIISSLYKRIVKNANMRNLECLVSPLYLDNLFNDQDKKCSISGVSLVMAKRYTDIKNGTQTASLDRIDSSKGYIEGNVQWVHKDVNAIKMNMTEEDLFNWATKIFFNSICKEKLSWDDYYMLMTKLVSSRSPDPSTKHGCVICSDDHRVESTGYNGPPQLIPNEEVPLTRPEKYDWMLHAEENALIFSGKEAIGSTVYVTGMPCPICMRKLVQQRVKEIVIGPQKSKCVDDKAQLVSLKMAEMSNIKVREVDTKITRAISLDKE